MVYPGYHVRYPGYTMRCTQGTVLVPWVHPHIAYTSCHMRSRAVGPGPACGLAPSSSSSSDGLISPSSSSSVDGDGRSRGSATRPAGGGRSPGPSVRRRRTGTLTRNLVVAAHLLETPGSRKRDPCATKRWRLRRRRMYPCQTPWQGRVRPCHSARQGTAPHTLAPASVQIINLLSRRLIIFSEASAL